MQRMAFPIMIAVCAVSFSFVPARQMNSAAPKMTAGASQGASETAGGKDARYAPFNEQILLYVNQFRSDNGKPPLTMNQDMVETAAIHSTAMAKGTVAFGHDNFDLRFKYVSAKLGGVNAFAENVAMGEMNAQQVVDGWAHSPGHRKNMLGDYNLTGIATATASNGTIYFTQIFAHKQ